MDDVVVAVPAGPIPASVEQAEAGDGVATVGNRHGGPAGPLSVSRDHLDRVLGVRRLPVLEGAVEEGHAGTASLASPSKINLSSWRISLSSGPGSSGMRSSSRVSSIDTLWQR